jgi:hypothetical protein
MITSTAAPTTATGKQVSKGFTPLIVDLVLPIGAYYLLDKAVGLNEIASLAASSAIPAVRALWGVLAQRRLNPIAVLMLVVNGAGLLLSLVAGDPRLMVAKDGALSFVIGTALIVSAVIGRPLLSVVLRPMFCRGEVRRLEAWDRLSATSTAFRRAERKFTLAFGVASLAECAARVIGAYTLPVDTMVWLGAVVVLAAIAVATRVGHRFALLPMKALLDGFPAN